MSHLNETRSERRWETERQTEKKERKREKDFEAIIVDSETKRGDSILQGTDKDPISRADSLPVSRACLAID